MQGAGVGATAAGRDHLGVVTGPRRARDRLSELFRPRKTTYTQIQFVDSAAAGQGGRARGSDLFAGVRHCAALVAVVRDFENPAVPITGGVDPERDRRAIEDELILSDLGVVEGGSSASRRTGASASATTITSTPSSSAHTRARGRIADARRAPRSRGGATAPRLPAAVAEADARVLNQDEHSRRTPPDPGPGALSVW